MRISRHGSCSARLRTLSPGLRFALLPDGRLRALAALGAPETRITAAVLPLLAPFAEGPADPRAVARAQGAHAASASRTLARLAEAGLLVPAVAAGPGALGRRGSARGFPSPADVGARGLGAFADVEVHRRLLTDVRRVERFGAAIAALVPGRRVVEIGTGTGVLAVLAAKAGAARVVAIEESPLAALAREVVRANGVDGVVQVVEAAAADVDLPPRERGEVLVAELLGGDPLDEGLLGAVADARARLLAPRARTIPSALAIEVCGIEARDDRLDAAGRLDALDEAARALGVDLGPVRRALVRSGTPSFTAEVRGLEAGGGARIVTSTARALRFDLEAGSLEALMGASLDARADVSLVARLPGLVNALAVSFRATLAPGVELSNAPVASETHWGQLIVPLDRPRAVRAGGRLRLRLRVRDGAIGVEGA